MDLNTLRVYNVINKLGITELEFDNISKELLLVEYTGTAVMKVTEKFMITINHDDKHKIEIVPNHSKLSSPGRILFKTYFTFEVPIEIYVLHELAQYRCDDNNPKYTAINLDELKDSIMDRICDKKYVEVGEIRSRDNYSYDKEVKARVDKERKVLVQKQLNAIYWLFGETLNGTTNSIYARANIPMIVKVFQRKNRRLAIIQFDKDYDTKRGNPMWGGRWVEHVASREIRVNIYKPAQPQYNYVNEGRELLWDSSDNEIWLDDDLKGKIPSTELKLIIEHSGDHNFTFLNSKDYGRIQKTIRIKLLEDSRKEIHSKAEHKVRDTIETEFNKGKIVRQGITFTHKSIMYDKMLLEADKIKEYVIQQRVHLNAEPEFTTIFEGYVDWLLKLSNYKSCSERTDVYYSEFTGDPQSITINNIKIVILKEHNFLFVNNRKISKFDIAVVVKNAINYIDQSKYDEYVNIVSKTNLKVQQAVAEGYIAFDINFDKGNNENFLIKDNQSVRISIPILREKNKNYTIINDVRYAISNTEALFDIDIKPQNYYSHSELNRAIKLLYKAIKDITPKVIGELLIDGKTAHKKHYAQIAAEKKAKVKLSTEFLAHAVKITKAKKIAKGYSVVGLSGTIYTINSDTLAVYKNNGKDYLCIVDVGDYTLDIDADALKNDRVAKRLLALHKDTVVANEIYSKGDRMDQHWRTIQEDTNDIRETD
jgi:hypothetical protein